MFSCQYKLNHTFYLTFYGPQNFTNALILAFSCSALLLCTFRYLRVPFTVFSCKKEIKSIFIICIVVIYYLLKYTAFSKNL